MKIMKLFFATFFIAELIIAFTIIFKIRQLNKAVNKLNQTVSKNKYKIAATIEDFRYLCFDINRKIKETKEYFHQKRNEYLIKASKTILIYLGILFFKGKYRRTILAYQLIKEIYAGIYETKV